jgi:hypothetical protein
MPLKDQISDDMKTAMRAKDSARLGTIRLLMAAIKQREVDERIVLDDAAIVGVVDKLIKQRKDSITAFQAPAAPIWSTRKAPSWLCCRPTCRRGCRPTRSPPPWAPSWLISAPAGRATWAR